jgi:hypothetical protein
MDVVQIVSFIGSFIGIVLLFVTYLYVDKLEKIGCACAAHPYQKFVKNFPIFAIVYLALTMFLPPSLAVQRFGMSAGGAIFAINILFAVAAIVFFVLALQYVRYLKVAKCACSEDVRREVLYWWAILELVILGVAVVLPILFAVLAGAFALTTGTLTQVSKSSSAIRQATVNPIKSARAFPASLKKTLKAARK